MFGSEKKSCEETIASFVSACTKGRKLFPEHLPVDLSPIAMLCSFSLRQDHENQNTSSGKVETFRSSSELDSRLQKKKCSTGGLVLLLLQGSRAPSMCPSGRTSCSCSCSRSWRTCCCCGSPLRASACCSWRSSCGCCSSCSLCCTAADSCRRRRPSSTKHRFNSESCRARTRSTLTELAQRNHQSHRAGQFCSGCTWENVACSFFQNTLVAQLSLFTKTTPFCCLVLVWYCLIVRSR